MDVTKVLGEDVLPFRTRKPAWFKVPRPGSAKYRELSKTIADEGLHTVCQEAACPNIGDCWDRGTATFMILGDTCTRRCGFCNVKTGKPTWNDPLEPLRVARCVARMGLRHAVITCVDRDDLPDYGASVWCGVIRSIRMQAPDTQDRVPDARLPRRGDAAGEGHRRAPRRLQPQRRGRAAAVPGRAPRLALAALAARAHQRAGDGRGRGRDQVRPDGRAAARRTTSWSRPSASCARPASRSSPSASTCARPSATCRSSATGRRRSSPRSRRRRTTSASSTSPPARSCAPATTRTSTSSRTAPASARWPQPSSRNP